MAATRERGAVRLVVTTRHSLFQLRQPCDRLGDERPYQVGGACPEGERRRLAGVEGEQIATSLGGGGLLDLADERALQRERQNSVRARRQASKR
jgi:hypothetical protein